MALKHRITKDEHSKLPADIQTEYNADGDNFVLDVTGIEDAGALKRAKDRESQLRKDAEKALKEAQDRLDSLSTDDARKKGDIETLEKKWKSDLDTAVAAKDAEIGKYSSFVKSTLIDKTAMELATKISNSPALILPHIKSRLVADMEGDTPTTKVLGPDGKVSTLSIDDLSKEFVANKDFAGIMIGSKASGGAGGSRQAGGAGTRPNPQSGNGNQPPDLSKMSPKELVEHIDAQKGNKE